MDVQLRQWLRGVHGQHGVAAKQDRLHEPLQGHQQAVVIVIGLALVPQGVELIQHIQLGPAVADAVEHLNAAGLAHGQDQRQVVFFQGHWVQVQRAVGGLFLAQVIEQGGQGAQGHMPDLAGYQLQRVVVLLDLDQVALVEVAQQQVLRGVEDLLDPPGNELCAVVAEALDPQARLPGALGQVVEVIAQAVEQGVGPVMTIDQHFIPAVERDLVEGQYQVFTDPGITQRVGALGGHQDVQVAVMLEWVDAHVHQNQHLGWLDGTQQLLLVDAGQGQGDGLLQAAQQVEQLELTQVAAAWVQRQAGAAVDHAVSVAPGQQLEEVAAAFERREVFPLQVTQAAVVQPPMGLPGGFFVGRLHQRQGVFGQIRGYARVDELDLVGLAFEGRIEPAAEYIEVAFVDQADAAFSAGKLAEEAIAVVELVDQGPTLGTDLADLPLAAAVEQCQLSMVPAPLLGQPLQELALPAAVALSAGAGELAVDLEVQGASHQLQAFRFAPGVEVLLDTAVHHDVGVEFVQLQAVGEHRLLEAQAQAFDLRMLTGVDLDQQQLEHRLVGRLDAFEQLPEPGADEFPGRNVRQVTEVEGLLGAHKTLGQQGVGVQLVAGFFIHRYQPPDWRAPGEPDRSAIELVQQQIVLAGAAVFGAELAIALAADKPLWLDQETMGLGALAGGPGFEQLRLFAQFGEFVRAKVRGVADPQVHIALIGLGQGAEAAHQEQAVNRLW